MINIKAIKILNKSILAKIKKSGGNTALEDVRRECAILKKLNHPNVVFHCYDYVKGNFP